MTMPNLTRRTLLSASAVGLLTAPAILRAQMLFRAFPFTLGVASGDPAPDGFVIWTRLAPEPTDPHGGMPMQPVPLQWEVASDDRFKTIVRSGDAVARPELGHSVHVEIDGLMPGRQYWYRFHIGRETSITGRARTTPALSAQPTQLRIGVAGCQNYEQGLFTAYRHLSGEDVDFVYHYGDYIYEGRSRPQATDRTGLPIAIVRKHDAQEPFSLDDYRRRYAQYKLDPDLQAAHASAPFVAVFDDHEVDNNWAGDHDEEGAPPEAFRLRRAAAFQAWYEHLPVRRGALPAGDAITINRILRWGDLLQGHFLDTRQFRTPQPCGDGFRTTCPEVNSPDASFIGTAQERWLAAALAKRDRRWNLLAQQVMMMDLDRRTGDEPAPIYNLDSWAGYAQPRRRVLETTRGLGNVVVLTGDEHQNYAGLLSVDDKPVAVEFVGTSVSSGGDGQDVRPGIDRMLARNPNLRFNNDQRGYLVCTVGRDTWQTDFMVVDQVSAPGGKRSKRASFTVPHNTVALTQS